MKSLPSRLSLAIISLLIIGGCSEQQPNLPSLNALLNDRVAARKVNSKNYEEAYAAYYKILESDPDLAEVHSNIAILFLNEKKNDDALKSLQQALKLADKNHNKLAQFAIHYNLGVYYGLLKQIPDALENYQAALDIVPDSKEAKTNIELLIQQGSDQSKDQDKKNKDKNQGDSKDKKDSEDKNSSGDDKDKKDEKDDKGDDPDKKDGEKSKDKVKPNAKYKPRPYQGDQLSEGDVKKILGELKSQEQKIRANFEKKERKESKNGKDW